MPIPVPSPGYKPCWRGIALFLTLILLLTLTPFLALTLTLILSRTLTVWGVMAKDQVLQVLCPLSKEHYSSLLHILSSGAAMCWNSVLTQSRYTWRHDSILLAL